MTVSSKASRPAPRRLGTAELSFKPLTPETWEEFQHLFEEPGIQNGCWCMYWRTRRADCQHGFEQQSPALTAPLVKG